jgi:hypothetical protein
MLQSTSTVATVLVLCHRTFCNNVCVCHSSHMIVSAGLEGSVAVAPLLKHSLCSVCWPRVGFLDRCLRTWTRPFGTAVHLPILIEFEVLDAHSHRSQGHVATPEGHPGCVTLSNALVHYEMQELVTDQAWAYSGDRRVALRYIGIDQHVHTIVCLTFASAGHAKTRSSSVMHPDGNNTIDLPNNFEAGLYLSHPFVGRALVDGQCWCSVGLLPSLNPFLRNRMICYLCRIIN